MSLMRTETRKWIARGNKDLGTAGFALNSVDGPLPVTTGLHCQEAVEKYLKAYLQEHGRPVSRQHSLNSLFEFCVLIDPSFKALSAEINQLAGYSIASRYPKADEFLEFRKYAIATAQRVRDFILEKLA